LRGALVDPVIPDLKTLKLLILRTLSAVRHQHKFNLLGSSICSAEVPPEAIWKVNWEFHLGARTDILPPRHLINLRNKG
jgi:hypothetical protein